MNLAPFFARPQVLACTTLSEVLPLDVIVLQVQVDGWGWLDIRSPRGFMLRQFFASACTLDVAVPVRESLTLKVVNAWGSRSYPIDTSTRRDEVWRAPASAADLRMPTDHLQPVFPAVADALRPLPQVPAPPEFAVQVPPFKLRAAPAELKTPELKIRPLPDIETPTPAPSRVALPVWSTQVPIADLESRMGKARITR